MITIEDASAHDAEAIAAIYNPYVLGSTATFEMEAIDAAEMILTFAPETNGHVAVKAWDALSKQTGREHAHLALARQRIDEHREVAGVEDAEVERGGLAAVHLGEHRHLRLAVIAGHARGGGRNHNRRIRSRSGRQRCTYRHGQRQRPSQ